MTFLYTVSYPRGDDGNKIFYEDDEFEFEPCEDEVEDVLVKIIYDIYLKDITVNDEDYHLVLKKLRELMDTFAIWDEAKEEFYDDLKDYFHARALEEYYESRE